MFYFSYHPEDEWPKPEKIRLKRAVMLFLLKSFISSESRDTNIESTRRVTHCRHFLTYSQSHSLSMPSFPASFADATLVHNFV